MTKFAFLINSYLSDGFRIFKAFLPEGLLDYFDIVDFKELGDLSTQKDCFFIYLDEKNILHSVDNPVQYESKGFNERTLVQDFPILVTMV